MAFLAQTSWEVGSHNTPGVLTGNSYQLAGVLDPGSQVDIASVYVGGIVALVGSYAPSLRGRRR